MNIWSNAVVTTAGLNLLAKLIDGNTLDITRAVAGAGFVTPGLLMAQKEVTDIKQELSFTAIAYPEDGKCALTCNLGNEGLSVGYTAMQVGIFATDPDDGEVLFFIAQAAEGTGTHVPANNEMGSYTAEWTFYFQYGNADNVTVTVDPTASVTQAMLDAAINVVVKKLDGYVPTTRKVNGKALNTDITLSASDVGAVATTDMTAITNEEIDELFDGVFNS